MLENFTKKIKMTFKFTKKDKYNDLHPNILNYMQTFVDNRIQSFEKLKISVDQKNLKGIRDFCHNNIGVAGSYKCFKLEEITYYVQSKAKAEDIDSIKDVLPIFNAYLQSLKREI